MQADEKGGFGSLASLALVALSATVVPPVAHAADCNWHQEVWGSYCVLIRDEPGQKQIEVILGGKREGTKVMTYRGSSLLAGSIFIDDEYSNRYVLQFIGPDKVILQDENGNPPAVYYR